MSESILLGIVVILQIGCFGFIVLQIGKIKLKLEEADKFSFLNFWLAFLSVLLVVIGLIVPYMNYSSMKDKIDLVDKKLEEIGELENNATQISLLVSNAAIAIMSEDYEFAINEYDKAIEINDDNAGLYNTRGYCKYKLKMYEQALHDFNKALKLDKNKTISHNSRGLVNFYLGRYREAVEDFNKALELEPNREDIIRNKKLAKTELEKQQKKQPRSVAGFK